MELMNLKNEFASEDIEWRIQSSGLKGGKPWGKVLAYITNRAIMDRLDEVCGPENWKNEFSQAPEGGVLCTIYIKIDGEWIGKTDGAENTDIESVKGGLSNSMKRAAVHWGIGRYLYHWDVGWATFDDKGKYSAKIDNQWFRWNPPGTPAPKTKGQTSGPETDLLSPDEAAALINQVMKLGGKATSVKALGDLWTDNMAQIKRLPTGQKADLTLWKDERKAELEK